MCGTTGTVVFSYLKTHLRVYVFDTFLWTCREVENVTHCTINMVDFRELKIEKYEKIIHFSFTSLDCSMIPVRYYFGIFF